MSDNIKVVVKVRPLISRELEEKLSYQWRVKNNTLYQLDQNSRECGTSFTFDKVYDTETETCDIYNDIAKPIVEAATAGFNGTIFAYGQTSSGKTYTMTGTEQSPGIIPLAVCNMFEIIKNIPDRDFLVRVSYIEIYNETLKDLLNVENKKIKVYESLQGVKVDCTEQVTTSPEEVLKYLKEGEANRQTGATNMNEESSRSHSIFQITIESREHIEGEEEVGCVNVSQLNLVDLAGSERAGQTGATGIRFKEGTHINKSLSALALVIKQLSEDQNKHVNYRDSKLTRILQNSLGGNAKTSIICAITPAAVEETISTLQFANRAKAIKNKPEVNAVATDATMIQSLTKQLSKLQSQLEKKKNLEVMLESKINVEYNLQKQIAGLQRLILNGFEQRSAIDMMSMSGSRRKLVPPRRITISTLHPIDEDPVPSIPKFHTPLLKYNPMMIPGTGNTDFVPIQNASKLSNLSALPEENDNRLITPPPNDKKVNFNDEIIDLDSDDDNSAPDIQTCSPYHRCYGSSKTPPCILRKNAKMAEKNLKDIVELTEREKIYTPSVVELIEKLEKNDSLIARLEDEVQLLNKKSNEKDLEISQLKLDVTKSNDEIKAVNSAKAELEVLCKEYTTKLTDYEVSLDTLKAKSKRREDELLSLLEEQKVHKKYDDSSKLLSRNLEKELNFMDMSKDISLVNSDNESSVTNLTTNDDESTSQVQDLVKELQNQILIKNQLVLELEGDLLSQKRKILSLENSNQEVQNKLADIQEKVKLVETENDFLKTTVDTLNSTIKSQKATLESANNDIDSYNSLIQELQIKLTNKEKILNIDIAENYLEKMITNEEKFIANNENMKNIIYSFKLALDSRNKEIESLKSVKHDATLKEQLNLKEVEIEKLNEKSIYLQSQINENITLIDNLMKEKTNFSAIKEQLTSKLSNITDQNNLLEKESNDKTLQVNKLKESYVELLSSLTEKNLSEKELQCKIKDLERKIEDLVAINEKLLQDIVQKNLVIASLKSFDLQLQEYISSADLIKQKIQRIIPKLTGKNVEFNDEIHNVTNVFAIIKENLVTLDEALTEKLSQKEFELKNNLALQTTLQESNTMLETHVVDLKDKIELLKKDNHKYQLLNDDLRQKITTDTDLRDNIKNELENKIKDISVLETTLNKYKELNESLQKEMLSKDNIISSFAEKEKSSLLEKQALDYEREQQFADYRNQIEILTQNLESKEIVTSKLLLEKENIIIHLQDTLQEMKKCLDEKATHLENINQKLHEEVDLRNKQLHSIFELASKVASTLNIFLDNENLNLYDSTILALHKIANYSIETNKTCDNNQINNSMLETINSLTQQKNKVLDDLLQTDQANQALKSQIDKIQLENKLLNDNLLKGNEIIDALKKDLNEKANEIDNMLTKTKELKDHFTGLDIIMKEQLKNLQADKDQLSAKCSELEIDLVNKTKVIEIQNLEFDEEANDNVTKKLMRNTIQTSENVSPPSLLTICCNKIVESIQPSDKSLSPSDSNTSIECKMHDKETQFMSCECQTLLPKLKSSYSENERLTKVVEQLEALNKNLLLEHEEVRREIQFLVEPAYELQKKIANHKTQLSTLTATTYAENKSLNSQVKVLQHHHSRFHNVCQKDLPVVKKQLHDLLTMLKGDSSYIDKHNASFKRFSLPIILGNTSTLNTKNESTLDGDLLMLDTNMTLTTSADNTLMGLDQTCLDLTQPLTINDVGCQTNEITHGDTSDHYQLESLVSNNLEMSNKIQNLELENEDLKQQIYDYLTNNKIVKDTQSSPIKIKDVSPDEIPECKNCEDLKEKHKSLKGEINVLAQKLLDVEAQRTDFEKKYNNLVLDVPSTDALVKKLTIYEKELNGKGREISKLKSLLTIKQDELNQLLEERDALSNQVMENITETDDLSKELDKIKDANAILTEKCCNFEKLLNVTKTEEKAKLNCSQCQLKDDIINSLKNVEIHSKLNRSLSDSDTSSRYNKICTLQNELHAGREDCKELTEEVATIKNHLDRNNLSIDQNMDLDESMGESNIFTITKQFDIVETQLNKLSSPNATADSESDIYSSDKIDCINFYVEKTGVEKENLDCNVRLIDIMKMFYNNFIMQHNNEVENLVNKIKCYEESKKQLESYVKELLAEYTKLTEKLEEKESNIQTVNNILTQIKQNIPLIHEEIMNHSDLNKNKVVTLFKDKLLNIIDNNFDLSSVNIFEMAIDNLVNKHQKELASILNQYSETQDHMESLSKELISVSNNLQQMKCQLTDKENEYNLLKAQKERIHEISNAVTLDLVRKEQELCQAIVSGCSKLVEHNILTSNDFNKTLPLHENINMLFNCLLSDLKNQSEIEREKEKLTLEIKASKTELEENQRILDSVMVQNDNLKEKLQTATLNIDEKDCKLQAQITAYEELVLKYRNLEEKNSSHRDTINAITQELNLLKTTLFEKEAAFQKVNNETQMVELYNTVARYKKEIDDLKSINEIIIKEKESSASELEKSRELLKTNNLELEKMTSDILILRESVKDNMTVIDNLKMQAMSLLQQNLQLKDKFEEKCRDCSRLEMNIKTHEKTAEIQSRMINRLQKNKEEDDKTLSENKKRFEELSQRYTELVKDCEIMKSNLKMSRDELEKLKSIKGALELRLTEMEMGIENQKPRVSIDGATDSTRTRRQSIYDSRRMFSEKNQIGDHNKMEAVFDSRSKPTDLFMDVDDDSSNRSTPHRNSKRRDSISKHDQSEEPVSRPSSVAETRRRRQSIHDMHRTVCQTPSPNGRPSSRSSEISNRKSTDVENNYVQSEVVELRQRLSSCQQELEELKEQYRELDEECDTCAQYLRERDEQCGRLKKEKAALEGLVTELKDKLQSINPNRSQQEQKTTFSHAAVNTDEDWANLHSVVVDRMSFDAEVDKNKRLTKTIEELRFKKQDLKLTLAKMQKALEKNANRDHSKELELAKSELKACKQELKELKEQYKELDEECETCSQYLREREDQCRKLKEAKAALETKLREYSEEYGDASRGKRRSALDRRRSAVRYECTLVDAATQMGDDFLNNQVERDNTNDAKTKELKHLKMAVERLSQQKASLEQQLAASAAAAPVYVATGSAIVQTQQLSDVMKENQKLKKINTKLIDICKKRGKKPDFINED